MTVFPKDRPAMLTAHGQLASAEAELTRQVKAGEFATAEAAMAAVRAKVGSIVHTYDEATRKGPPPVKRNPLTGEPVQAARPPTTRP